MQRGAVFGCHVSPLLEVPSMRVLEETHLLCQEMVQETHSGLLPLAQPVEPVTDMFSQFI